MPPVCRQRVCTTEAGDKRLHQLIMGAPPRQLRTENHHRPPIGPASFVPTRSLLSPVFTIAGDRIPSSPPRPMQDVNHKCIVYGFRQWGPRRSQCSHRGLDHATGASGAPMGGRDHPTRTYFSGDHQGWSLRGCHDTTPKRGCVS